MEPVMLHVFLYREFMLLPLGQVDLFLNLVHNNLKA